MTTLNELRKKFYEKFTYLSDWNNTGEDPEEVWAFFEEELKKQAEEYDKLNSNYRTNLQDKLKQQEEEISFLKRKVNVRSLKVKQLIAGFSDPSVGYHILEINSRIKQLEDVLRQFMDYYDSENGLRPDDTWNVYKQARELLKGV